MEKHDLEMWMRMLDHVLEVKGRGYTVMDLLNDARRELSDSDYLKLSMYERTAR